MAQSPVPSGFVIKEGLLGKSTEKIPTTSMLPSLKPRHTYYWWVLKQAETTEMACYKDSTKTKLRESLQFTNNDVEVSRHAHDNYICIKRGRQVTFIRAENRQQRDDWYKAIVGALGAAGPDAVRDASPVSRRRMGTDTSANRPPTRRGRNQADPQTVLGMPDAFSKEMIVGRSLPPLPTEEPEAEACVRKTEEPEAEACVRKTEEPEAEACVRKDVPYCCLRYHLVACSTHGSDEAAVYENIHFVRSEKEWIQEVEARRRNLGQSSETYTDFNAVLYLQSKEHIYEARCIGNDLSQDDCCQRPVDFHPNLVTEEEEGDSLDSNEDNTTVDPSTTIMRRAQPPIPTPSGQPLQQKIERIKFEQKQVYGIEKTFQKESVLGDKVKLMEMNDGICVIGWSNTETHLRGALKVGDQLIKINKQTLTSASFARDTIRSTDENEVTFVLRRIPYGTVCTIRRDSPRDDLGIKLERNEITSVDPYGLASSRGDLKPQTTGVSGCLCNWAITEINTQPVDLFASTEDVMRLLRQAKEEVTLIVQPVDFIQMMRDKLATERINPSRPR